MPSESENPYEWSYVACSVAMPSQSTVLKYCHSTLCSNAQGNDVIALQRLSVACSLAVLIMSALHL